MKKTSERAALILVGLLALVVVAFVTASMVTDRNRAAVVNRIQKPESMTAYEQLTAKLAPPQAGVGDQKGQGADSSEEGMESPTSESRWGTDTAKKLDGYKRLFDDLEKRQPQYPNLKEGNRWDELTESEREELRRYLGENQDLLEQIREMARAGGPAQALDFSKGYAMELPHLAKMRAFARLLSRDAYQQAQSGNMDLAVEDIVAVMQLGDALADEPILISQLVRIAIYDAVNEGLVEAFAPGELSPEAVDTIVAQLAQGDNRQAFADSLSAESLFGLAEFERLRGGEGVSSMESESTTFGIGTTLLSLYASPLARPFLNNDEATYAEIMSRMSEAAILPYYEAKPALTQIDEDVNNLSITRVFSRILLPALSRADQAQARHESMVDVMQMGLLLEQYYGENGKYPETLDAIGSGLGGKVPLDPFTGGAYVYKPSATTFLLYGVGMNGTDEGGTHNLMNGDIVWRGREAEKQGKAS